MDKKERARQRWLILKEALSGSRSAETSKHSVSVRRFEGYGLLNTAILHRESPGGATWYMYTCPYQPELRMNIRHLPGTIRADTLLGFNNTGNVCVWPAEEVMTYYCLKHIELFKNKSICELGGGMTCLAGVALCSSSEADTILLTDGNEDSVKNLEEIIGNKENKVQFQSNICKTRLLRWGPEASVEDLKSQFDFVICADCLFFEEGREDLIKTLHIILKDKGTAFMFAPKRGTTFDDFVSNARATFHMNILENYDDVVWNLHCKLKTERSDIYDENIHYPLLIEMSKKPL